MRVELPPSGASLSPFTDGYKTLLTSDKATLRGPLEAPHAVTAGAP
jgi:hypothetical protein